MVVIETKRCSGGSSCAENCPTGVIYLMGGKAAVDKSLCRDCKVRIAACPIESISRIVLSESPVRPVPVPPHRPVPQPIQMKTEPKPVPRWSSLLPVVVEFWSVLDAGSCPGRQTISCTVLSSSWRGPRRWPPASALQ